MKNKIKEELIHNFKKKFKRNPNEKELKNLDFLAFQYSRDLKNILRMEINDFKTS